MAPPGSSTPPFESENWLRRFELVKGGDYRVEQIAGGDTVLKNGGEVRVLGFKPGRSTSALIDALRRSDG